MIFFLAKMFEDKYLELFISALNPLCFEADRFKQRSAVESLAGLLRGIKHWKPSPTKNVWAWFMERLPTIFAQIRPDTNTMWESFFNVTSFFSSAVLPVFLF